MSLIVRKAGFFTTVQDLGRPGWRKDGVPEGGAMDGYALRTANLLVGNDDGAAGLELTLAGPELEAACDLLIAVCGAYMSPLADGEELPMWRPVRVAAGTRLKFGPVLSGCRAYIAVAGGIGVASSLGSRSTDTRLRIGGLAGRRLEAGDALPCVAGQPPEHRSRATVAAPGWFAPPLAYGGGSSDDGIELRAMPGAECGRLGDAARAALFGERYRVAPASDRMGVRLEGPPLAFRDSAELLSHGVVPGTVQLPAGGTPIILAADCQTTGGYPVVAHVIAADLPLLAQAKPGDTIRFAEVSLAEAQRIDIAFRRGMRQLAAAIALRLPEWSEAGDMLAERGDGNK